MTAYLRRHSNIGSPEIPASELRAVASSLVLFAGQSAYLPLAVSTPLVLSATISFSSTAKPESMRALEALR